MELQSIVIVLSKYYQKNLRSLFKIEIKEPMPPSGYRDMKVLRTLYLMDT
jgi:hypothetical protein